MKYVCVFNRNRDNYEVAVALHERGLLRALVTDFYADGGRGWRGRNGPLVRRRPSLARRHRPELDGARVVSLPTAFLIEAASDTLSIPHQRIQDMVCGRLVAGVAREATRHHDAVFAYAGNLPRAYLAANPGIPSILFQFHPHTELCRAILAADVAKHPEVRWSYETEPDSARVKPTRLIDDWRHAERIVCASAFTRRSLEHVGCPTDRVVVIPYGTDPAPAEPEAPREGATTRFLFVGQGVQRKGLHHLAHAWKAAALPDAELTIVTYRIDPGIEPLLRQPNVTLKRYVPRDELLGLFKAADVFVMPSLIEGFGLVYLEALERGCFVIGTPNTGLPDLGLADDSALLCEPGGIESIVEALRTAASRHKDGGLDRAAIRRQAADRTWAAFRERIGAEAAVLLAENEGAGRRRVADFAG